MAPWRQFTAILGLSRLGREVADPQEVLETCSREVLLFLGCSSWQRWQAWLEWSCPAQKGRLPGAPQLSIRHSIKCRALQISFIEFGILTNNTIHSPRTNYVCRVENCLLPPRRSCHLRLSFRGRGFDPLDSPPWGGCWSRRWQMLMWCYLTISKVGPKEGTFSAHPRIDPTTNQMYFFSGYCAYYVKHPTALSSITFVDSVKVVFG